MRKMKRAVTKHLEPVGRPSISKDEVVSKGRAEALKIFGYADEGMQALRDVAQISTKRLQELTQYSSKQMRRLKEGTQKVFRIEELERRIEQGWTTSGT